MARNFYWQAGWNITLDNPFFGVGLDRFGDWYWAYRSEDSIRKLGPENFSTSAHNVFLDISSSGGFPLLCTYLIFLIFIFFVALNYILRSKNPDKFFIASFSIWISLQIYSLISIGHIGLMVWNWIFAGLIVAKVTEDGKNFPTRIPFTKTKILFSMIVCFLLVFPLAKESVMSKSAFKENSVSGYVEYLNSNKIEPRNISLALTKLQNSSNDGLDFAREAVKRFPNYYDLWFIIYVNPNSSIDEKRISLSNLLRLNPYNAELLKSKT
jgi:hypothetical protein